MGAIAALIVSVAVLIHLARTDPKRRRVFGMPEYEGRRWVWLSLAVLCAPGIALLASGDAAGFTIWLGALTVLGWGVAAVSPARAEALRSMALALAGRGGHGMYAGWRGIVHNLRAARSGFAFLRDGAERIALLEARIGQLESEIEGMKPATRHLGSAGAGAKNCSKPGIDAVSSNHEAVGR